MSALFITFEGIDGSGKSTHIRHALDWLREKGLKFRYTKEPGGTPVGDAIREIFLDPIRESMDGRVEAMLVFASRRVNLLEVIEPALAAGEHVICDRFTDSSRVYQGIGRDLPDGWIDELDQLVTGGRAPDHTLLFDLTPEAAYARGRSPKRQARGDVDRIDSEELPFYSRTRDAYLALASREPERFHVINSEGAAEETWRQVERILSEILNVAGPAMSYTQP
jgi:dTMP kinase